MTHKNIAVCVMLLAFALLVFGCSKPAPEEDTVVVKKAEAPKVEEQKQEDVVIEDTTPPEIYVKGIRNPYRSPFAGRVKKDDDDDTPKTPLQMFDIVSFKVIAVAVGTGGRESVAMVKSEDNKTYTVKRNDKIGTRKGKVIKVFDGGIIAREEDPVTGELYEIELLLGGGDKDGKN